MKSYKRHTHYIMRTDRPSKAVPFFSLDEAKKHAETMVEISHWPDIPSLVVTERGGNEVACMHEGNWVEKGGAK